MNAANLGCEVIQGPQIFLDKGRPLQQVLGRVPDQGKLREDGQGGSGLLGPFRAVQNQSSVGSKITDDGISLTKCNLHCPMLDGSRRFLDGTDDLRDLLV